MNRALKTLAWWAAAAVLAVLLSVRVARAGECDPYDISLWTPQKETIEQMIGDGWTYRESIVNGALSADIYAARNEHLTIVAVLRFYDGRVIASTWATRAALTDADALSALLEQFKGAIGGEISPCGATPSKLSGENYLAVTMRRANDTARIYVLEERDGHIYMDAFFGSHDAVANYATKFSQNGI